MSQLLPWPGFWRKPRRRGGWFVQESALVLMSVSALTLLIALFRLPAYISDSLLLYLVLILGLAVVRGLYAALLASCLSFFCFDFFFLPPVRSLHISKFEDILSLFVFLLSALLTSYLAAALRRHIALIRRKEHHARLLYQLAQTLNRQETLEKQLSLFAGYFEEIFGALGLQECLFLLPDPASDQLRTIASDSHNPAHSQDALCQEDIPLSGEGRVKGILRLRLAVKSLNVQEQFWSMPENPGSDSQIFFSTLIEHAITVIQQEERRQERVQLQIVQQTEKLRSALLTSVSHDLRRPLTTIRAAAESLRLQSISRSASELCSLHTIERESDWLDNLIENLLDMSRIEAGALQLHTVWYALDTLIYDVLVHLQARTQGRQIALELPADIPLVTLDVVLIEQVLINLLTNALTYTPDTTPITIQVLVEPSQLLISIRDRGSGIVEAEREHIFEKFYRLNPQTREGTAGLGLGLAICRGIIEAHQGQIHVEENPGGGAVFAFTLPYTPVEGYLLDE